MYETDKLVKRIKTAAKMQSITLKKLYSDVGLNKNVSANLNSGSMLKADSLAKIADKLKCSTDYLLGRTDDFTPPDEKGRAGGWLLTTLEKKLLTAYRETPSMQSAVDKLLNVETDETISDADTVNEINVHTDCDTREIIKNNSKTTTMD